VPSSDDLLKDYQRRCESAGPDHLDTLQVRSNLVAMLIREARYDEALEHSGPLVDARERIQGPERADTLKARRNHALALWLAGRTDEARSEAQSLAVLCARALGERHQLTDLVTADCKSWGVVAQAAIPERQPEPSQHKARSAPLTPGAAAVIDAIRASGVSFRFKEPDSGEGWSPAERRAAYARAGVGEGVVDDEARAESLVTSEHYDEGLNLLDDLIPRLRQVYSRDGRTILRMRLLHARCLVGVGRTPEAHDALRVLLHDAEDRLGNAAMVTVEIRAELAMTGFAMRDAEAAGHLDVLAHQVESAPPIPESAVFLLQVRAAAAVARGQEGQFWKAYGELSSILDEAVDLIPSDDPWLLRLRYNRAAVLGRSGNAAAAIPLLRDVVADMDSALGRTDVDTRDSREVLARFLEERGQIEESKVVFQAAMEDARQAEGPSSAQAQRIAAHLRDRRLGPPRQRFGFSG
jgi:hypothetical protein